MTGKSGRVAVHAGAALLPGGWQADVRLECDEGTIRALTAGVGATAGDIRVDILVPGMPNLHSHAFQRAMAGFAERRGEEADNFWSWRETMYGFALSMTPDDVEAVAGQLYMEMLEAGFTRVGEFHYLHHDADGSPYADIAEMAERIAAATVETGIGLTLLPVFYAHGGFGGLSPVARQRRFINTLDSYQHLLERCRVIAGRIAGGRVGVAPHSLRAVTPEELRAVIGMAGSDVVHIHIAEQVREVEESIAFSGARPVEWLLENAEVNGRWCLIHATHLTDAETRGIAASGAVVGLCPITEANLGDGVFLAPAFLADGGRLGIGSDSNIRIGVAAELSALEYSQRLHLRQRNVIAPPGGSTGRCLFDGAVAGGERALGGSAAGSGALAVGRAADFVTLNRGGATYLEGDTILDNWLFGGDVKVDSVWVEGIRQVENGLHRRRSVIERRFVDTMKRLRG